MTKYPSFQEEFRSASGIDVTYTQPAHSHSLRVSGIFKTHFVKSNETQEGKSLNYLPRATNIMRKIARECFVTLAIRSRA